MNNEFFKRYNSKNTLCRFRHRFVFWVINLYEVVSIEVVNFHAGFQKPVEKDGYFWGKYELLVSYRRNNKEAKIRQKRFTRGFFFTVPFCLSALGYREYGEAAGYLKNCKCEAEFSHQITPLFLMFFPLFSRLKYVPFKAVIYVHGMITEAADEGVMDQESCCGEACHCLEESSETKFAMLEEGKGELLADEWSQTKGVEYSRIERDEEYNDHKKQTADVLDLDLIALDDEKNVSPKHESEQSQTHLLFYNMIMEHQESIHDKGNK